MELGYSKSQTDVSFTRKTTDQSVKGPTERPVKGGFHTPLKLPEYCTVAFVVDDRKITCRICEYVRNASHTFEGVARCHPHDKFDQSLGMTIAYVRAWIDMFQYHSIKLDASIKVALYDNHRYIADQLAHVKDYCDRQLIAGLQYHDCFLKGITKVEFRL